LSHPHNPVCRARHDLSHAHSPVLAREGRGCAPTAQCNSCPCGSSSRLHEAPGTTFAPMGDHHIPVRGRDAACSSAGGGMIHVVPYPTTRLPRYMHHIHVRSALDDLHRARSLPLVILQKPTPQGPVLHQLALHCLLAILVPGHDRSPREAEVLHRPDECTHLALSGLGL